jgi:GGDEF domain-containing protein
MTPGRLRGILNHRRRDRRRMVGTEPAVELVDRVTGLASAAALELAASELATRSFHVRAPIAIARFRVVGTPLEDAELASLVARAQVPLRHYDRLYRVGSAELLLLLPGSDAAAAVTVASRVRQEADGDALAAGISSSLPGEPFVFEWISAKAEEALERAEDHGGLAVVPSMNTELVRGAVGGGVDAFAG